MNLKSGLFKLLYWPICRAYARHILGDKPADKVMRFLCSLQFWQMYRYWPNFINPSSFFEKMWHRMLHDRDPKLTLICDKLLVRDYVAGKVGVEYLVPLLWSGNNPYEIPFDKLPLKFVIKTNHGCGYNIIVGHKSLIDQIKVKVQLKKWLGENYCQEEFLGIEWGYKNIKPAIIIESFIEDKGKLPIDYKFYCFSGRVEIVTLFFDRFEDLKAKAVDRNFEPFRFRSTFKQYNGEYKRPPNFNEMVHLAESLAEEFDFIRVDLYNVNGKIYFGELTPYPGGGFPLIGFDMVSQDSLIGEKWKWK